MFFISIIEPYNIFNTSDGDISSFVVHTSVKLKIVARCDMQCDKHKPSP